jgi:molybdenum cofactor cytidylyltransferase
MSDDIWALLLAAGQSKRMGQPKMLLPAPEGNLLRQSLARALYADSCRVAVVAARNGPLKREHAGDEPVEWIESDRSHLGLGASLAFGLRELIAHHSPRAVMILLGDQPDLESSSVRQVAEAYRNTGGPIVQIRYADRAGHPVLFDAALYPELLALTGDTGAREVLRHYEEQIIYVHSEGTSPPDIDTPEEYWDYLRKNGVPRRNL